MNQQVNKLNKPQNKKNSPTMPKHVAIIMDGNGRWAKLRNRPRTFGHRKAELAIRNTVEYCLEHEVLALTFFVFSTENWQRPKNEVDFIMNLLLEFLKKSKSLLIENKIKLTWIGRRTKVPGAVKNIFDDLLQATYHHKKMTLCLAVDYGAQTELIEMTKKLVTMATKGEINPADITKDTLESLLYTKELPPLDLLIRTSGEFRLSNFLLWQAAYSELYFCDTLWPDFGKSDLEKAFTSFNDRSRRWGKVSAPATDLS